VLIGNWKLKAIKTEASLRSLDDQVKTKSKISSDSLLTIKIKKDSIYIIRQTYYNLKDTFAYTYSLKTDTSYSSSKYKFILHPNKSRLKGLRKWHKKSQKELSFNIIRLTNSQLTLGDVFTNNYPSNPFSDFTFITYYFEKVNQNSINELAFKGKWFFYCNSLDPFGDQDTLKLERDSIKNKEKCTCNITFRTNHFKKNDCEFKRLSWPKPSSKMLPQGVLDGIVETNFSTEKWKINTNKKLIIIENSERYTFKYLFSKGQLLLIKHGS